MLIISYKQTRISFMDLFVVNKIELSKVFSGCFRKSVIGQIRSKNSVLWRFLQQKNRNNIPSVDNTPEYVSSDIQKRYSKRANLLYLLRSKIADRISMITSGIKEYRNRSINSLLYNRGNKRRINRMFTGIKFDFYSTDRSSISSLSFA